jgi:prefoldin subunit 5
VHIQRLIQENSKLNTKLLLEVTEKINLVEVLVNISFHINIFRKVNLFKTVVLKIIAEYSMANNTNSSEDEFKEQVIL